MATQYQPNWDSLVSYGVPEWFVDSKFGLYAHWGLYSVPGFGDEWYGKHMYNPEHDIHKEHIKHYGALSEFGYKDFIPHFTAEKFDPDEWAELFKASGAGYAGFSLAHHDGFGLWDSEVNPWNAGKMGPKRDLYGEMATALRKQNLRLVAPFHILRTFNWFLPDWNQWTEEVNQVAIERGIAEKWDLFDPEYSDFYWIPQTSNYEEFFKRWQAQVREVIDKYQPDMMWFDSGKFRGEDNEATVLGLLAHYLNQSVELDKRVCVLNKLTPIKEYNFHPEFGVRNFESGRDRPSNADYIWNDDMRIGDPSWGWVENQTYATGHTLISRLVDSVSRGGTLMLSLSPKADGTIPEEQQKSLRDMGQWLQDNGEAIYSTRPWRVHGEGDTEKIIDRTGEHPEWVHYDRCNADDRRYTQSKGGKTLYALTLGVPETAVTFEALDPTISVQSVSLIGSEQAVDWQQSEQGMTIDVSNTTFNSDLAVAWRIELG